MIKHLGRKGGFCEIVPIGYHSVQRLVQILFPTRSLPTPISPKKTQTKQMLSLALNPSSLLDECCVFLALAGITSSSWTESLFLCLHRFPYEKGIWTNYWYPGLGGDFRGRGGVVEMAFGDIGPGVPALWGKDYPNPDIPSSFCKKSPSLRTETVAATVLPKPPVPCWVRLTWWVTRRQS